MNPSNKNAFVAALLQRMEDHILQASIGEGEFARSLGSSDALFKNLRKGSMPSVERLSAILSALGEGLVIGKMPNMVSQTQMAEYLSHKAAPPEVEVESRQFATVARHDGFVAAGDGYINFDADPVDRLAFSHDWLKREGISAGDCFLISVRGDSMAPCIGDGDLVMIDKRKTRIRDGKIYAFNDGDRGARIKRLDVIPDVGVTLRSDNPSYQKEYRTGVDAQAIDIIGQVIWSGHKWG